MHPRAAEMVAYAERGNPACLVHSSTNGHFFGRASAPRPRA